MKTKTKDLVRALESLPFGPITAADISAAMTAVTSALTPLGLFRSRLSEAQRHSLASKTPGSTARIVEDVARGMVADPEAYRDLPFTGAKMQALFDEAQAAEKLWSLLSLFVALTHDHHLTLLAECGTAARSAVRAVREAPGETAELIGRRIGGLGEAPQLLAASHKRAWRTRHRKARAEQAQAQPAHRRAKKK